MNILSGNAGTLSVRLNQENGILKINGLSKYRLSLKRLVKNKNSILTFLHHPKVPPDNNASEQAIRNVKVKIKVSGQFRSERGATRFAILHSVIDTTIKNTQNIFQSLSLLANLET